MTSAVLPSSLIPAEAYTRPPCRRRRPTPSPSSAPRARSASASRCGSRAPACRSRSARATPHARARNRRARERRSCRTARSPRTTTRAPRAPRDTVILSVPFRNQSETLANLKDALTPGQLLIDATVPLAAAVSGKATRMLGVWQGSAAQQAREMAPDGRARGLGPAHRQRRLAHRSRPPARPGRARVRRLARGQARGGGADRADRGPALRRLRTPGDVAHHRVADGAADLRKRPLQGARGDPPDGPARARCGSERIRAMVTRSSSSPVAPAAPSSRGAWPMSLDARAARRDREHGR